MQRGTAIGLFVTTCGLLLLEVFATRVLAIAVGAFAVYYTIAVAMLGMGAAGTIVSLLDTPSPDEPERLRVWLQRSNLAVALGVALFFFAASTYRAHTNATIDAMPVMDTWQFMSMQRNADVIGALVVGTFLAIPYFFYGFTLAVLFRGTAGTQMARLYTIDLVGAFAGSFGAILALEWGGYSMPLVVAIVLPAFAAIAFGARESLRATLATGRAAFAVTAIVGGLLVIPGVRDRLEPHPSVAQLGHTMWRFRGYHAELLDHRWSSHGLVSAVKLVHPGGDERLVMSYDQGVGHARLWRANDPVPLQPNELKLPPEGLEEIKRVVELPRFVLAVTQATNLLVLGAGAGADMIALDRLTDGKANISGVELVGDTVEWARDHLGLAAFYDRPNIHLEVAEAREFIARDRHHYDGIIMPSLQANPGYFMGTSSYGFAFTATREGLTGILDRLSPGGAFAFVLYNKIPMAIALGDILRSRGADPAKSMVLLGSKELPKKWWVIRDDLILMVKPSGFTREDIDSLEKLGPDFDEKVLYHPYQQPRPDHPHVTAIVQPDAAAQLEPEAERNGSTILPVTDDRPFPEDPMTAGSYLESRFWLGPGENSMTKDVGRVWETRRLHVLLLLGFSVLSVLLIVGPLLIARRLRRRAQLAIPDRNNHLLYFGLLGLAFMFVEMGYILKLRILIGHPGHTIAVVLSSVILFTGVGSWLSRRTFASGTMNFRRAAIASACLALLALLVFELVVGSALGLPRPAKYAVAFLIPILPAMAMGHLFPQGLAALSGERTRSLIPLCLAMNALTGTLAAGTGPLLTQALGCRALVLIGAVAYAIVALMPHRSRHLIT